MNKRKIAAVIIETVIIVWTIISVFGMTAGGGNAKSLNDLNRFCYFTVDSNIFSALASAVVLVQLFRKRPSRAAALIKFTGTVSVTVTFLTVMCFLGPMLGYRNMLSGHNLYLHLIGPVLAILSLWLPEDGEILSLREGLSGLIPVFIYGTVYAVQVLVVKAWPDFYGFTVNAQWWVSFLLMMAAALVISFALRFVKNRRSARIV